LGRKSNFFVEIAKKRPSILKSVAQRETKSLEKGLDKKGGGEYNK
jgi:hypothetical protein